MVFSSSVFLIFFLPLVLFGYYLPFKKNRKYKSIFWCGASVALYAYGEPVYVVLLLCSVFANWFIGLFNCFWGSVGGNVGVSYCGVDDFELLLPNFETDITYISEDASIYNSGSFDEALISWSHLERINYYRESCYAAYMNGRQSCAQIYNHMADNDIRMLFISDSFGATTAPFLALTVAEINFIDPRLFTGSIESYIRESEPDIVVVMMNPEVITEVSPDSNDSMYMLK